MLKNNNKKLFLWMCALLCWINSSAQLNYTFTPFTIATYTYNPFPTILVNSNVDELLSPPINLGFTFYYQGIPYTQIKVSSNGWLTFNTAASLPVPNNDLSTSSLRPILAPLWDDLRTGLGGNVNYRISPNPGIPTKSVMTVEWKLMNWNHLSSLESISFQVKLYDSTNVVEFLYRSENFTPSKGTASVGIAGTCSNDYYSLNDLGGNPNVLKTNENFNLNVKPTSGQVYKFTPKKNILSNDVCANAIALTYNVGFCNVLSGTVIGATATGSPAAPPCWSPSTTDADVWYTVTKPAGQTTMLVSTDNIAGTCNSFSTELAVYSGTCGVLSLLGCASNGGSLNSQNSILSLSGLPNIATTYYIRVEGDGNTQGDFQICVKATNDECSGATVLTPDVVCNYFYSTSAGATNSGNPPSNSSAGYSASSLDVWFRFTASSSYLIIDTKDLTLLDGTMYLYQGSDCAGLSEISGVFPDNQPPYDDDHSNNGLMPRIVRNDFVAGSAYFLRIWGNTAPLTGTFGICISERQYCVASNAADTCSFAPTIGLGTWCGDNTQARVTSSINGFPTDPGDPLPAQFCKIGPLNYNATVDNLMFYKFITNSAGGNVKLDVYNQICQKDNGLQVGLFKPATSCPSGIGWGNAITGSCYDATKDPAFTNKYDNPINWSKTFNTLLPSTSYYLLFDGAYVDKCTWTMTLSGALPLPIELLSFTAKNFDDFNLVEWETKTETNNNYFTLERSADGNEFEFLGNIQGAGNSVSSINYSFKLF